MITDISMSSAETHRRASNMEPYYSLWAHVLRLGIAEAMAENQACKDGIPAEACVRQYAQALAWMEEERNLGPGSFIWLCELLDLNPVWLRAQARANDENLIDLGRSFADLASNELSNAISPPSKRPAPLAPAKEPRVCAHCGETFNAFISRPNRYCSRRCLDELKRERSRTARVAALQAQNHTSIFPCLY